MQKRTLLKLLAEIRKYAVQRRFIQSSETSDVRRVKSLLRTQLERKTDDAENKWLRSEITTRGKPFADPLLPKYDRYSHTIELPITLQNLEFWPSMWFMLDRIAEARYERKQCEKAVISLVKQVPAWEPWGEGVVGLGPVNFANVLSATGDLWLYANPGKVWKRMGLALVDDLGIQRKSRDKDLAKRFGYSPSRRSLMFVVSEGLMRGGKKLPDAPVHKFKLMYDARKIMEMAKEDVTAKGHAHNRALRYVAKRFLKELWQQWRVFCPQ